MVTRSVLRYVDWTISPDTSEGAPSIIFEMECTSCSTVDAPDDAGSRSPASEDFAEVQAWALRHSGRHPTHRGFREIVHRFWRTHPGNRSGYPHRRPSRAHVACVFGTGLHNSTDEGRHHELS